MLANIIIFSNELWWLSVALLNSARLLGMSGYLNHFPREFPTDQKCLWGLPELLHFQDVILFFPPQGLYPWERRWHWGRKAGFCSQLCACLCGLGEVALLLYSRARERVVVASKGAGVLKWQRNLATGNPPVCCSQQMFPCSAVQGQIQGGKNEIQLLGRKMFLHSGTVTRFHWENKNIL